LWFSNNTIQKQKSLQLPKEFSGRKIIKLNKNNYLVLSNNGSSYIIDTKKLEK
jgi:7-keto-8-aminopelargonate synthetase-like enzyme